LSRQLRTLAGAISGIAVLCGLGCGTRAPEATNPSDDASTRDTGASQDGPGGDSGASLPDAPTPDATPPDGAQTEGGSLDGSRADGSVRDAGGDADISPPDATAVLEGGAIACGAAVLGGGPTTSTPTHLDIGVHDPSMIWDGTKYYLFATGGTLNVRRSADILTWTDAGNILAAVPAWVTAALGSTPTDLWAPDISYFNGKFHVYYAGSTFGSNDSVIGLATTGSLASSTWADEGLVLQSRDSDDFNAIDPNLSFDEACTPWLAFGSYWSGIRMRKMDGATGKPAAGDTTLYSLASRNGGAIEAASVISHNGYYYLFVSFDLCCKGVDSTYRTMVGRGTHITGPYTDKAGRNMMQGAAEQLLATSGRYIGPGGGTAWKDDDTYLYVYHYYDGDDNGAPKLQVRPITFDSTDWIVLGAPLFP
jgi:arabinan endo-1,5-alpha-L-arabinosidase